MTARMEPAERAFRKVDRDRTPPPLGPAPHRAFAGQFALGEFTLHGVPLVKMSHHGLAKSARL
jgi:hypothetical protein